MTQEGREGIDLPVKEPGLMASFRQWAGMAVSVACLALMALLLTSQVSLASCRDQLASLDLSRLWLPLLASLLDLPLRTARWQNFFAGSSSRPNFRASFSILAIATMCNNWMPARGGDFLRCLLFKAHDPKLEVSQSLGLVAAEKALDTLALALLTLLVLAWLPQHVWSHQLGPVAWTLVGCCLLLALLTRVRLQLRQSLWEGQVGRFLARFWAGLSALRTGRQISNGMAFTALVWAAEVLTVVGLAACLHISLPLASAGLVCLSLALGWAIPGAPAGLGTCDLLAVMGLRSVGLENGPAVALAFFIRFWSLAFTSLLGGLCFAIQAWSSRTRLSVS